MRSLLLLALAARAAAFEYDYSFDEHRQEVLERTTAAPADVRERAVAESWDYRRVYTDAARVTPGVGTVPKTRKNPNPDLKEWFAAAPPNIVIFYADDLGWGDLGAYGHPTQQTPFLDRLAKEGMRMKDFYAPASVCSPSRAGLITGRLQTRTGVYPGFINPTSTVGLDASEYTLPKMLKDANPMYRSMLVGKWHLGAGKNGELLPTRYGFDYFTGIVGGIVTHCFPDMPCYFEHNTFVVKDEESQVKVEQKTPLLDTRATLNREEVPTMHFSEEDGRVRNFRFHQSTETIPKKDYVNGALYLNEKLVQQPTNSMDMAFQMMHAAVNFLNVSKSEGHPAFLYLNFYSMHRPLAASPVFYGTSLAGIWGDTLKELDFSIGYIMKQLHEMKMHENTLVIFSSDNGPTLNTNRFAGSAGPFKCGKGTTYEGGMRVPGIFWMPKYIKPRVSGELASQLDIFPTIMEMVGGRLPDDLDIDGRSMYGLLFENTWGRRKEIFYWSHSDANKGAWNGNLYAVRSGIWKLHFSTQGSPSHAIPSYHDAECPTSVVTNKLRLFHLGQDPGEKFALPIEHPAYAAVVNRLTSLAEAHIADMGIMHPSITRQKQDPAARPCCGRATCTVPGDVACCLCQPDPDEELNMFKQFFEDMRDGRG